MLTRERAYEIVKDHIKDDRMFKHCLACEAVMRALARHLGEDEEKWGLVGLLHDLDYLETKEDFYNHGRLAPEIAEKYGVTLPEEIKRAILAHVGHPDVIPQTLMEKAIYAVDPTTGFIVAAALISKQKKLNAIDVDFLMRRFKEKRFAAGADRSVISSCEDFGVPLEEFLGIALKAMQEISDELGL